MTAPTPPAARDAGVGELVDMIALALTWVPMGALRVKAGIALSTLAAAAQPAVVDAGATLPVEEWISDVLILRDHADSEERDILTRTAERLRILATAAPLAPAAVDAGTLAAADVPETLDDLVGLLYQRAYAAGQCTDSDILDIKASATARDLRLAIVTALAATAAQPARAVPAGMVMVGAEALEALLRKLPGDDEGWGNLDYDDIIVAACDLAKTAIIHPAPADASEAVRDGE